MRMLRSVGFTVAAAIATLMGCTSTPTFYGPQKGATVDGAKCSEKAQGLCAKVSGNTINSWGPRRYDYLAPSGDVYRWQGNDLKKGQWYMAGSRLCRAIPANSPPRCRSYSELVGEIDSILISDPFGLSARAAAPTQLTFGKGQTDEVLLNEIGVDPSTVTILTGSQI